MDVTDDDTPDIVATLSAADSPHRTI